MEQNTRDFEITKHISLALIDPLELLALKDTGSCNVHLPEELFDLDFPGHYFRRIKSVSVSLPCVVGPYTSVSATMRLLKNVYRKDKTITNGYKQTNEELRDPGTGRFRMGVNPGSAIATSNAQMDSGVFELNFRDERYLPFEGAGAISDWSIELSPDKDLRQFNYSTISDLILHIKYTARDSTETTPFTEGVATFKSVAIDHVKEFITTGIAGSNLPLKQLFNLKLLFSTGWHHFFHPLSNGAEQELIFRLSKEHFPFFAQHRNIGVDQLELITMCTTEEEYDIEFNMGVGTVTSLEMDVDEKNKFKKSIVIEGNNLTINGDDEVEMKIKLKQKGIRGFTALDTDPEEVEEMFLVIKYHLKS